MRDPTFLGSTIVAAGVVIEARLVDSTIAVSSPAGSALACVLSLVLGYPIPDRGGRILTS